MRGTIFSLCLCSLLLPAAADEVATRWRFHSLGAMVVDSGEDLSDAGSPGVEKRFERVFLKSELDGVRVAAFFRNEMPGEGVERVEVTLGLFDLADRPIQVKREVIPVERSWSQFVCSQRFGWSEAGRWDVGTYRMRVWLDESLRGESTFFVSAGERDPAIGVTAWTLTEVDFFEGDNSLAVSELSEPAEEFSRRTTRGIHWMVRGRNPFFGARVWIPDFSVYVFQPDGTLMGVWRNLEAVPPEREEITLTDGFGWNEAGNWMVGEYRVEFEQGNRLVLAREFRVTDPVLEARGRPWAVHIGVAKIGVFAGEREKFPPFPENADFFSGEDALSLWGELVVENNPNHSMAHEHEVFWQLVGPDGEPVAGVREPFRIESGWKTARQRVLLDSRNAGEWPTGSYKLLLSIDGRTADVRRFTIGEPE